MPEPTAGDTTTTSQASAPNAPTIAATTQAQGTVTAPIVISGSTTASADSEISTPKSPDSPAIRQKRKPTKSFATRRALSDLMDLAADESSPASSAATADTAAPTAVTTGHSAATPTTVATAEIATRPTPGAKAPANNKRFESKKFFLTYPKCNNKEAVHAFLCKPTPRGGAAPVYVKTSLEHHADGSEHIHALVIYDKERQVRLSNNPETFDVEGHHPNVQIAQCPGSVDDYISKEDEAPLVMGEMPDDMKKKRARDGDGSSEWATIVSSDTKDEFMAKVRSWKPRDYALNHEKLIFYANSVYKTKTNYVSPFSDDDFFLPRAIKTWLADEFTKTERAKCLCLIGPTRCGKTAWARSLGQHVFWRGLFSVTEWRDEAKYLVLDDIDWEFLPNKKQLLTAMGECILTDKYVKKTTLVNYKPAIYLCNTDPRDKWTTDESSYWGENMTFVTIKGPLFRGKAMTMAEAAGRIQQTITETLPTTPPPVPQAPTRANETQARIDTGDITLGTLDRDTPAPTSPMTGLDDIELEDSLSTYFV